MLQEICYKCGYPMAIKKIKIKGYAVDIKMKCHRSHEAHINLPMDMQQQWLPQVTRMVYRCEKCGAGPLVSSPPKSESHYIKFHLMCPHHGERNRKIDTPIYYTMNAASTAAEPSGTSSSAPNCAYCGQQTTWVQEYRRHYCYNCRRYHKKDKKKATLKVKTKPKTTV